MTSQILLPCRMCICMNTIENNLNSSQKSKRYRLSASHRIHSLPNITDEYLSKSLPFGITNNHKYNQSIFGRLAYLANYLLLYRCNKYKWRNPHVGNNNDPRSHCLLAALLPSAIGRITRYQVPLVWENMPIYLPYLPIPNFHRICMSCFNETFFLLFVSFGRSFESWIVHGDSR